CAGLGIGWGRLYRARPAFPVRVGCDLCDRHIIDPAQHLDPDHSARKTIIHATNDARDLYKANDTAVPILGDAKLVLAQLAEAAKERLGGKARTTGVRQQIEKIRGEWLANWQAKRRSTERPINPYFVMSEFMRVIPSEDAIVTHDSGSPRDQLLPFYVAKKPRGYMGWGK